MKNKQLIFNSFPRSGNVYSQKVSFFMINCQVATVHIPQIFGVEDLNQVTLFRKPVDAIASLIYKQNPDQIIEDRFIINNAEKEVEHYREYIKYATMHHDKIYIGRFDDLANDPVGHFKDIAKRFDYLILPRCEENVLNIPRTLTDNLWTDEYDGHYPRNKSDQRQRIEEVLAPCSFLEELRLEAEEFLAKYQTKLSL
jgi:hypothetical protein